MRRFATLALACLAACAVAGAATASDQIPTDALAPMRAANADWVTAMKAKDAAAIVEPYADDGVFVRTDGSVAAGKPAILALYRKRLAESPVLASGGLIDDGAAAADGDVYEWGHGDLTFERADGTTTHAGGRFLTVWRKGGDGRWRIIRNLTF
ncbi:MAG TPA: SgcJ/EcaC family oxidoreductase [Caulobacteraceae bacterium]|jgi:uncharacterized protein (TIGR02246 family)|nr:SgcJ/EcaC family oxidoreductase [Caulobacteraceae bacterium]